MFSVYCFVFCCHRGVFVWFYANFCVRHFVTLLEFDRLFVLFLCTFVYAFCHSMFGNSVIQALVLFWYVNCHVNASGIMFECTKRVFKDCGGCLWASEIWLRLITPLVRSLFNQSREIQIRKCQKIVNNLKLLSYWLKKFSELGVIFIWCIHTVGDIQF